MSPGGPWLDRVDGSVAIRKLSVSEMDNNVYVISCVATGVALVIDAADDARRIREALVGLEPTAIAQTHGHWDHVRAWEDLRDDPGLPIWGHPGDLDLFPHEPDRLLAHGDRLTVGDLEVEVIHIPGHTPGSCLYRVAGAEREHLFTGDTLFPGGPGNTRGNARDFAQIMDGLTSEVFARFDDSAWIYPGHGNDTTVGTERPHLDEWRARGW